MRFFASKKGFLFALMLGVVGLTFLLVHIYTQTVATELVLPKGENVFRGIEQLQYREEFLVGMDVSHANAAYASVADLYRAGGYDETPECGMLQGGVIKLWYAAGVDCVPTRQQLQLQLARFMEKRHAIAIQQLPMLVTPEEKATWTRRDFLHLATIEDGSITIASFAVKPLLTTFNCMAPDGGTRWPCGQLAIRPALKSIVSMSWPLPEERLAALMTAVRICQTDPVENTDPKGCLEAVGRNQKIDMSVGKDETGATASVTLPTGVTLPNQLIPLSLHFGIRVTRMPSASVEGS